MNILMNILTLAKVIVIILPPWQLGSPNTRSQERLGFFNLSNRSMKRFFKIKSIFRYAIGCRALQIHPDELIGVKLGGVSGKVINMNPSAGTDEFFNRFRLMNGASIPKKHKAPLKMPQDNLKKVDNLGITNILRNMKAKIELNASFVRGYTDRRDGGNLSPSASDFKNRCFSNRGPGLLNRGNKQKPALVEKNNRNTKFFGLFLYAATDDTPIVLSSFHPVPALLSQVSGSSSQALLKSSKHARGDKKHQTVYQLPPRFSVMSKDPWNNHSSSLLLQESGLKNASGASLISQAVPEQVLVSKPCHLSSYKDHPSNTLNLTNNRASLLFPAASFLYPRAPRPAAGAFQALFGFHVVSWNQHIILLLLMQGSIVLKL